MTNLKTAAETLTLNEVKEFIVNHPDTIWGVANEEYCPVALCLKSKVDSIPKGLKIGVQRDYAVLINSEGYGQKEYELPEEISSFIGAYDKQFIERMNPNIETKELLEWLLNQN